MYCMHVCPCDPELMKKQLQKINVCMYVCGGWVNDFAKFQSGAKKNYLQQHFCVFIIYLNGICNISSKDLTSSHIYPKYIQKH